MPATTETVGKEPIPNVDDVNGLDGAAQKEANLMGHGAEAAGHASDSDDPSSLDIQAGVKDIEAITSSWNRTALILAYIMVWVIYFVDSLQSSLGGTLAPYVTSNFESHSLTPTVSIFSSIIGGVFKLTLAKILDVFGRPHGYALCVVFVTAGLIMMAACQNVETYAAAQVFYEIGYLGLGYSLDILIADSSYLKNRGLWYAYSTSPFLITTWIAGPVASSVLAGPGFRWGYGIFCIVTPITCLPLFGLFMHYYYKAKRENLIRKKPSGRTTLQSIHHYAREFDVIGLLILTTGIVLFLLPFNIYSYQKEGWKSPMIICFLVFGLLLICLFVIWEKFFAPVKFLPYELFLDRTFMGACVVSGSFFISYYCWDAYFFSFLQVVNNLSVTHATYLSNTYTIGSCLFSFVAGWVIRRTGSFKWICVGFGIPITILGVGLMIKFRQPNVNIGYIVMCQIFIAFGGGAIVICEQIAAMAAVPHQYVAVVLAIEGMFSSIGGGIGDSISAAIWTGIFPKKLAEYLPEAQQANLTVIYGDLTAQLAYPVGSPAREAIQHAYGDAQRMMIIAGTAVLIIPLIAIMFWRDINVEDRKQVKGLVA